jgi:Ni/Co efflux regulator RcnB
MGEQPMKYILSVVAALCLLPGVALAQPGGNAPNTPPDRPNAGQKPHGEQQQGAPNTPMTRPGSGQRPAGANPPRPDTTPPRRPRHPQHRPIHRPPPSGVHRPPHRPAVTWHRPRAHQWYWRGRWVNRIRAPRFIYPRGYRYRHWSIGMRLPAIFLVPSFFYENVGPLGLEIPPPGYRWVRYGPDLFLVNLATGDIEQVAYGVFY